MGKISKKTKGQPSSQNAVGKRQLNLGEEVPEGNRAPHEKGQKNRSEPEMVVKTR